ncbi:hypothetical protein M0R45_016189 [Rubus argutus]|uniref:Uncharacterized protein n=1 Tax=Rubus argutus TaxID=59490 RepID=A0AAW1XU73_RUBAR
MVASLAATVHYQHRRSKSAQTTPLTASPSCCPCSTCNSATKNPSPSPLPSPLISCAGAAVLSLLPL